MLREKGMRKYLKSGEETFSTFHECLFPTRKIAVDARGISQQNIVGTVNGL